ncbi:MAG TPA: hypothetical protein VEG84_06130, partial [Thermoanaerobaculia bacterium]|nr:hypothetical protein [Thermoanaerobaculia bacterium]
VTVKPAPAEMHEALTYDFTDLQPDSVVVALEWDKLAVPFKVSVNVPEVAVASIRNQLRSVPGFTWQGYNDAATYCLEHKTNYDDALKWVDTSIQAGDHFANEQTKSKLLAATGKTAEADAAMKQALSVAEPLDLHNYGRQLLGEKKTTEALQIFDMNAKKNPSLWFVYVGLARGQSATGKFKDASKNMHVAQTRAPESQHAYLQGLIDKLDKGQDIN